MSDPIIPKGLDGLHMTVPRPSTLDILVATVCALLETIGELTGRAPEAQGLMTAVRAEFGGKH